MPACIEVSDLVKVYGSLRAVDGVTCEVRTGEVFAFLGPNGAGKTTTVEILEGLRPRTSGEVQVLGFDPWTQLDRLRTRIGVIPQDFHFFPKLTPREAIRLYASLFAVKVDVDELLARVELSDKADDYYDTLSGGQHQKLGVALALVNDPELCFLDEPTTGLDPRARRSIWDLIRRLRAEGRTVFLTTHYLEEAQQLSDRIAIINRGRIIASGAPAEIISRYGRPERLRIIGEAALAERLSALGFHVQPADGGIDVELRSKADALTILQTIASSGLRWERFSTQTDTLEDVFIQLVGRLEDGSLPEASAGGSP
ncbi:MAG TPA: ABC transporter ATP-binding protein [Thermoplasmata archaeon]|nr:ABC transporter ATP-binding protein [Thermoplasmata archaeon]